MSSELDPRMDVASREENVSTYHRVSLLIPEAEKL
jgi:hypothetical protein